jgi:hypothetical protein
MKIVKLKLDQIQYNQEYEEMMPELSEEIYDALYNDIQKNGIITPISVNNEYIVLDGHQRCDIATDLEIPEIDAVVMEFESEYDEKMYVINANLNRRHLTKMQRVILGMKVLKIEKENAYKRMHHKEQALPNKEPEGINVEAYDEFIIPPHQKGASRDIAAQKIGLSGDTLVKGIAIMEAAKKDEDIAKDVEKSKKTGKPTINAMYKKIKKDPAKRKYTKTINSKKDFEKEDEKPYRDLEKVPQRDFEYTCNIYQGCNGRCLYCYSRIFNGLRTNWGKTPYRDNPDDWLKKTIKQLREIEPSEIQFGNGFDAFPSEENEYQLTKKLLRALSAENDIHGVPLKVKDIHICTKTTFLLDCDIEYYNLLRNVDANVEITITCPDDLARIIVMIMPMFDKRFLEYIWDTVARMYNQYGIKKIPRIRYKKMRHAKEIERIHPKLTDFINAYFKRWTPDNGIRGLNVKEVSERA